MFAVPYRILIDDGFNTRLLRLPDREAAQAAMADLCRELSYRGYQLEHHSVRDDALTMVPCDDDGKKVSISLWPERAKMH